MKLLILGDTHGNTRWFVTVIKRAKELNVEWIIQLGDFGLWPGWAGVRYLDDVNRALIEHNVNLIWLDGNHEDFNQLDALVKLQPKNDNGQTYIRSQILYSPRGCLWTMDNKKFMTVGGAVSIDKQWRTAGKSWWPQEQLTELEEFGIVTRAMDRRQKGKPDVDYLFTHDCHPLTPFTHLINDPDSDAHRQKMKRIFNAVLPKMWFHGHMHAKYAWPLFHAAPFDVSDDHTEVYGLECDGCTDSWGILDTETDRFKFASDLRVDLN